MPETAPFCDVDLTPKWTYDLEKALFLNCLIPSDLSTGAIVGIVVGTVLVLGLAIFAFTLIGREKAGNPIFAPPT